MPYTKKQVNLANAVAHGFKPTGKAKGFSKTFAKDVIVESSFGNEKPKKKTKVSKY